MVGVYLLKRKEGYLEKYLNRNHPVGQQLYRRLKGKKQHRASFQRIITESWKLPVIGKHIVRGQVLSRLGGYRSPFIAGFTLASIPYQQTGIRNLLVLLHSLTELRYNIQRYRRDHTLTGDWASHNLVFNGSRIINVDLEGFYTYSQLGLSLSWEIQENKPHFVLGNLRRIQRMVINCLLKLPDTPIDGLWIVHRPPSYPLICPGYLDFTAEKEGFTYLSLQGPESQVRPIDYYCYLSCNHGGPRCLVTTQPIPPTFSDHSWVLWFSFKGHQPKDTPLHYYLTTQDRPLRTKPSAGGKEGLTIGHFPVALTEVDSKNKIVITQ